MLTVAYIFSPYFSPKINNSKFFPKLSMAHEKNEEETFLGGIVGRDRVRGEKTTTHPIFHNSYPVFGDFLVSVAGVGPIPQQRNEKGCRGPAQVSQAQGGPASAHPAWTAGQDTHSKSHLRRTWLNVTANS